MRYFLFKSFRIGVISLILFITTLIVISELLKYRIDPFYNKLTSTTNKGLILGDSRALQGIDPDHLSFPVVNFAFTIGHSPYDKSYIRLIKKKLNKYPKKHNTHIVCISPWSLLSNNTNNLDINPYFSEHLSLPLTSPNFEYLFKYVDFNFTKLNQLLASKQISKSNGYLMVQMDTIEWQQEYKRRVKEKIENYTEKYPVEELTLKSPRIFNLLEIINLLQLSGDVFIVRLPVSKEMLSFENIRFPNLNELMSHLSQKSNAPYLDLTDLKIRTTDGNHIFYLDVPFVSKTLDKRVNECDQRSK